MVMHARRVQQGEPGQPWLVLLHGLLGSGEDWQPILPFLNDRPVLLVDLPGHGDSRHQSADSFDDVSRQLTALLAEEGVNDYWLLGYSLGGRIAMFHACHGETPGLRGLLVEGGGIPDWRRRTSARRGRCMMPAGRAVLRRSRWHRCWRTGIDSRSSQISPARSGRRWCSGAVTTTALRWLTC
ncbi:alpha/beta fold hydrolase [Lonsdalea britannica]|uniref:alpha/beta fold hydrolase n=1 Tax=Lonsdalea britannica TaxID=1082704 RepID=UPI0020CAC842|nr:alpha/beta fold hydrolase [Lonsdalea britannica]